MNVSSVPSAKCGSSDFSIERILSDSSRGDSEGAPSWLCCTRYQPPRVPRGSSIGRARRSGRHARVPFTGAQAAALEAAYSRAPYLAPPALRALAAALHLRDDRIKIWFQNRRARERREKSGSITPPRAITLPSTASSPTATNQWASQVTHPSFTIRPNGITEYAELAHHSYNMRTGINIDEISASRPDRYYSQSSSISGESNDSRCDSPLNVETID